MIFYHEGTPGEVSHEAAYAYVVEILDNPITHGRLLWHLSDHPWARNNRRPLCAPGAMTSYLRQAALRELTQGEGWSHETVRARRAQRFFHRAFEDHTEATRTAILRASR